MKRKKSKILVGTLIASMVVTSAPVMAAAPSNLVLEEETEEELGTLSQDPEEESALLEEEQELKEESTNTVLEDETNSGAQGVPAALSADELEAAKILELDFENSQLTDNTGTVTPTFVETNGTPEFVEGHEEGTTGIQLNGGAIDLGAGTELQSQDLTISFWAKAPEGGYNGEQILFWCKDQANWRADGWYLTLNMDGAVNMMAGGYYRGSAGTTADFFPEGEWVHAVVVYDSTAKTFTFYKEGHKQETVMRETEGDGVITPTDCNKYIGQSGYDISNMDGALDDITVYNAAATQEQVEEMFGITQEDKLQEAVDALTLPDDGTFYYDATLQTKGLNNSTIQWKLDGGDGAVTLEDGQKLKVTRGSEAVSAELTATLTLGSATAEKTFTITIPEKHRDSVAKSVTFNNVKIQDEFWSAKQKQIICKVMETGIENVESATGGLPNLKNAALKNQGEAADSFQGGYCFMDTDPYKMMEAMSYALQIDPAGDEEIIAQQERLREKLNEWIPYVEGAQEKYVDEEGNPIDNEELDQYDGYLDTFFTLDSFGPEKRMTDFAQHELYCFGHFYEAAVAYTRATNYEDLRLFKVAVRNADMVNRLFGKGKWESYPGHQEIELALVKLAQVCEEVGTVDGEDYASRSTDYLNVAKFFLDQRGQGMNHGGCYDSFDINYRQDQAPVQDQREAVGHAVRAMYMYSGMTDIQTIMDSDTYDTSLHAIWDDLQTKTYVTGGIGSSGGGSSSEGFGSSWYLPNNAAYAETCANIGSMMWGNRMNLLYGDSTYIDTVETALYNSVISGVNFEGDEFFYSNPMSSDSNQHRSAWFGCACCPPNLMRTIASLGGYIYAQDDSGLTVNLYIGNQADVTIGSNAVEVAIDSEMPWYGNAKLTVNKADGSEFAMKLRVPGWADSGKNTVKVNGQEVSCDEENLEDGYVVISRAWQPGDEVEIEFPMTTEKYHSDERVVTNQGLAAVKRGPVVYAAEGIDNPDLTQAFLGDESSFTEEVVDNVLTNGDSGEDVYGVKKGMIIHADAFTLTGGQKNDTELTFIPYYAWNNRGYDTMRVYVKDGDELDESSLIAMDATVDSIYYNPSYNQNDKINDGDTSTFWCCWKQNEVLANPWVSYSFERPIVVRSCIVNWYDDGGGAQVPQGLKIEYLNEEGEWTEVTPTEAYDTFTQDVDNVYPFEEVTTTGLRLTMDNGGRASVAIREWKLDAEYVPATPEENFQDTITEVTASVKDENQVLVEWNQVENANSYVVYRKASGEESFSRIGVVGKDVLSYVDKDVQPSETYYYTVKGFWEADGEGISTKYPTDVSVTVPGDVDAFQKIMPEVTAQAEENGNVTVNWETIKDAKSYRIYRKEAGGAFKGIANVGADAASYVDETAKSGTTYYYTVKGFWLENAQGASTLYPTDVQVTTPVNAEDFAQVMPEVSAKVNSDQTVTVSWKEIPGAESYRIYRKTAGGAFAGLANAAAGETSYTDVKAQPGETYYYTVKGFMEENAAGTATGYPKDVTVKIPVDTLKTPAVSTRSVNYCTVEVSWNKVAGADKYVIYRKEAKAGTSFASIATVNGGTLKFRDQRAKMGVNYYYTVKAFAGSSYSDYQKNITGMAVPSAPSVQTVGNSRGVTVSWTGSKAGASEFADGYRVFRKTIGGSWKTIGTVGANTRSFTDTTGTKGVTYAYTVRAYVKQSDGTNLWGSYNTQGVQDVRK